MLLNEVEVYASAEDLQIQILREELSVSDVISYCIDESSTSEILDNIDEDYIVEYVQKRELIKIEFEDIVDSLDELSREEKKEIIWKIIEIDNEITKAKITKSIELQIVLPKLEDILKVQERNINPVWDYMDDYYFCVIDDTEVNIRGYSDNGEKSFHLWMYNNKKDDEVVDAMYSSYSELQETMMKIIKGNITFPSIESLLKITRGLKNV
ncbi:hypothetical protein JHD47_02810 [Sulfurimonas sp. SAG-AH-194-L11]|nr:hypothetical protein [Sulfurimonas sp. SAG-AH-194-L11]MDF1876743.1 hypothetical protein [Sulfurimonas sp. SAG-AH-194-L11]